MKFGSRLFAYSEEQYKKLSSPIARLPWGKAALKWSNLICAAIFYIAYPLCLLWLLLIRDYFLERAILIPAISFVILSIIRKALNRPRPYEQLKIVPLLEKRSSGSSFPSRHIFSAFMIAGTVAYVMPLGYLLYLPATLLALIRVIGGVHYPSDVLAGAIVGVVTTLLYFI